MSPASPAKSERFHLPALDGVRGLAFLLVFVLHALNPIRGEVDHAARSPLFRGALDLWREGVPLFFVLSAFLVTTLLLKERERTGRIAVGAFLVRRALRLWPLYFLVVALATFAHFKIRGVDVSGPMLVNYVLFLGDVFHMNKPGGSFVVLWSIGVEEKFYIAWSLALAALTLGSGGGWGRVRVMAWGLVAGAWIYRLAGARGHEWEWLSYGPLGYLDCFGYGILLALRPESPSRVRPGLALAGFLGGLWIAASLRFALDGEGPPAYGFAIKMGLVAPLCGWFLLATKGAGTGWPVWGPLRWVGQRSYGAYLFHWMLFLLVWEWTKEPFGAFGLLAIPATLGATLLLADLSYRYYEAPFLRLKSRFQRVPSR